jgi:hypothetical protein
MWRPMADDQSSFMISHFLTGLGHAMPELEQDKLEPFKAQAAQAGSDETAEWHRAFKCAKWAERVIAVPEHNALVTLAEKAIEIVKEVEETVGAEIGDLLEVPFAAIGHPVSPRFEAEITWVYEAVHVAERVAADAGWAAVPWQELVTDMLNIPSG